jgi:hypothetical protein
MTDTVLFTTKKDARDFVTAYVLTSSGINRIESRTLAVLEKADTYNPFVVIYKKPRKRKPTGQWGRAVLVFKGDDLPVFDNFNMKEAEGVSYGMQKHAFGDPAWLVEWHKWKEWLATEGGYTPILEAEKPVNDNEQAPIITGSGVYKLGANGLEQLQPPAGKIEAGKLYLSGYGPDIHYVLEVDQQWVTYVNTDGTYEGAAGVSTATLAIFADLVSTGEAKAREHGGNFYQTLIGGSDNIPDDWQPLLTAGVNVHCQSCARLVRLTPERNAAGPFYCERCAETLEKEDARKDDPLWTVAKDSYSKEIAAAMRAELAKRGIFCLSVTKGRGTASGWIDVTYRNGQDTPANMLQVTEALGFDRPAISTVGVIKPDRENWYHWLQRCAGQIKSTWRELWHPHNVDYINHALDAARKPEGVSADELAEVQVLNDYDKIGRWSIFILEHLADDGDITRIGRRYYVNPPADLLAQEDAGTGSPAEIAPAPPAGGETPAIEHDRDWTWVSWPAKPSAETLAAVKGLGFRWSKRRTKWYAPQHIEAADILAALNIQGQEDAPAEAIEPKYQPEYDPANRSKPADITLTRPFSQPEKPAGDEKLAQKLEALAAGLDKQIEAKENTFAGARVTARRQRFIENALQEAQGYRYAQIGLLELAKLAREGGKLPVSATKKRLVELGQSLAWKKAKISDSSYNSDYLTKEENPDRDWLEALADAGRDPEAEKRGQIRKLEAEVEISRPAGYYSTPDPTAAILLQHAPDLNGAKVLEPSAGNRAEAPGHLKAQRL